MTIYNIKIAVAAGVLTMLLSGCQSLAPILGQKEHPEQHELLVYYSNVVDMPEGKVSAAYTKLQGKTMPEVCQVSGLQAAMLATHPVWIPEEDVSPLLKPCLKDSQLGPLAKVVQAHLAEKASKRASEQELETTRQQLDALKAIERSIYERDKTQRSKNGR